MDDLKLKTQNNEKNEKKEEGMEVIIGNPAEKVIKGRRSFIIGVLFDRNKWEREEARKWMEKHFYKYYDVSDEYKSPKYWHFSTLPPEEVKKQKRLRMGWLSKDLGILARYGFQEDYKPEERLVRAKKRYKIKGKIRPKRHLEVASEEVEEEDVSRHVKITKEILDFMIENKDLSSLKLSEKIYEKFGVLLHPATIRRRLKKELALRRKTKKEEEKEKIKEVKGGVEMGVSALPREIMREAMRKVRRGEMTKAEALRWAWRKYRGGVGEEISEPINYSVDAWIPIDELPAEAEVAIAPFKTVAEILANPVVHYTRTAWFKNRVRELISAGYDAEETAQILDKELKEAILKAKKLPAPLIATIFYRKKYTRKKPKKKEETVEVSATLVKKLRTRRLITRKQVTRMAKKIYAKDKTFPIWNVIPVLKPAKGRAFSMEWLNKVVMEKGKKVKGFVFETFVKVCKEQGVDPTTKLPEETLRALREPFYLALTEAGKEWRKEYLVPYLKAVKKAKSPEEFLTEIPAKYKRAGKRWERRYRTAEELYGLLPATAPATVSEMVEEPVLEFIEESVSEDVGEEVGGAPGYRDLPVFIGDAFIVVWLRWAIRKLTQLVTGLVIRTKPDATDEEKKKAEALKGNIERWVRPVALYLISDLYEEQIAPRLPFTLPFGLGRWIGTVGKTIAVFDLFKAIHDQIEIIQPALPVGESPTSPQEFIREDFLEREDEIKLGEAYVELPAEIEGEIELSPEEVSAILGEEYYEGEELELGEETGKVIGIEETEGTEKQIGIEEYKEEI
ncbi:MAG: hypothetical protein ABIM98_07305 [candidate division WOR-3 bacterium]